MIPVVSILIPAFNSEAWTLWHPPVPRTGREPRLSSSTTAQRAEISLPRLRWSLVRFWDMALAQLEGGHKKV
jgi:hypothetical protein